MSRAGEYVSASADAIASGMVHVPGIRGSYRARARLAGFT